MSRSKRERNDRKIAEPIVAAASPGGTRVPVSKLRTPGIHKNRRSITVQQLAVLLWCLYRTVKDDTFGFLDAEVALGEFLKRHVNKNVTMERLDLERLLHSANLMDLNGLFWSPDDKSFQEFVEPMLFKDEAFDRQWNLIIDKDSGRRIRTKARFIKKLTERNRSKKND